MIFSHDQRTKNDELPKIFDTVKNHFVRVVPAKAKFIKCPRVKRDKSEIVKLKQEVTTLKLFWKKKTKHRFFSQSYCIVYRVLLE